MAKRSQLDMNRILKQISVEVPKNLEKFANREARKKADAIKNQVAKDKNIDMSPRQSHGEVEAGGIKVRVLGESADDFKFKIKRKK